MRDLCKLIWWALVGLVRSRVALEAENLALRQQINVLRRTGPKRPALSRTDRLIFGNRRHPESNQIGRQTRQFRLSSWLQSTRSRQTIVLAIRPAVFDR